MYISWSKSRETTLHWMQPIPPSSFPLFSICTPISFYPSIRQSDIWLVFWKTPSGSKKSWGELSLHRCSASDSDGVSLRSKRWNIDNHYWVWRRQTEHTANGVSKWCRLRRTRVPTSSHCPYPFFPQQPIRWPSRPLPPQTTPSSHSELVPSPWMMFLLNLPQVGRCSDDT